MIIGIDIMLVIPFALVLVNAGYWAKQTRVSTWPVPITVLEIILGLVVATVFSLLQFHSFVPFYVLCNGVLMAFLAVNAYDIVHGLVKKSETWKKLVNRLLGKKDEEEEATA